VDLSAAATEYAGYTIYKRAKREVEDGSSRAAKIREFPQNDRADRAYDRECSTSELTRTVSQCVSVRE
jgi:hypothetical protein